MLSSNVLNICIAAYMVGYLIEKKANVGVGALIRLVAAGIFVLVLILRLLGVAVG